MALRVSGKNLDIGPALRTRAHDEILGAVKKYYDGDYTGHLTVEKDGTGFRTECTVHLNSGRSMCVSAAAHDAYASVGQVVERIAKQMRRYKREKRDKLQMPGLDASDVLPIERESKSNSGAGTKPSKLNGAASGSPENVAKSAVARNSSTVPDSLPIVAEGSGVLPRMGVSAAAEILETSGSASLVFRNHGTGRVNILRKREDGSIGWIDVSETSERV
jgi:ribosomal subunit interface protein